MAVAEAALVGVGVSVVQLIMVVLAEAGPASVPAALAKVVVGLWKLHSPFARLTDAQL